MLDYIKNLKMLFPFYLTILKSVPFRLTISVPFLRTLTARLIERLRELDPDADAILALWQENDKFSDRAIAKALGRPQRTFADQMKRYRTELRKIRCY